MLWLRIREEKGKKMGHNEKDWSGEGKCIRNAAKFCAAPLVISLSLHTLKYPKGQISCVFHLLEVYIFPLSMEIIFCALGRVAQRNVPKWPCIQEPLLAAGLKLAFLSPFHPKEVQNMSCSTYTRYDHSTVEKQVNLWRRCHHPLHVEDLPWRKRLNKAQTSQGPLWLHVAWKKVQGHGKCWEMPYLCLISSGTLRVRHFQELCRLCDHLAPRMGMQDELNYNQWRAHWVPISSFLSAFLSVHCAVTLLRSFQVLMPTNLAQTSSCSGGLCVLLLSGLCAGL